jgi:hypothetical protein
MRRRQEQKRLASADRRAKRNAPLLVELLEDRRLLSMPGYPMPSPGPSMGGGSATSPMPPGLTMPTTQPTMRATVKVPTTLGVPAANTGVTSSLASYPSPAPSPIGVASNHHDKATGVVTKKAHFYEFYTGPKWAELNAVRASGELSSSGNFTFTGTVQGKINKVGAVYVWGIDRSGKLSSGPFEGRPNIKFDAVVIVSLSSSLTPTAQVVDLKSGATTNLAAGAAKVHGKTVSVTLSESLLPSTGLTPSQYRFNFWPEFGGSVASFVPEFTTAQVGMTK